MSWVNAVVGFLGVIVASGIVAWWLNRKLNREMARQAHADANHAEDSTLLQAREQARVWYDRWQEEVDAREADRVAHRKAVEDLQAALAKEVLARSKLESRVDSLVAQMRTAGLQPTTA